MRWVRVGGLVSAGAVLSHMPQAISAEPVQQSAFVVDGQVSTLR